MKSALKPPASKPKPSPLEGSGHFRVQTSEFSPQQISRHEWWLWFSALFVTFLSALAFVLSSIHSFFLHADYFYEIRSDQARWATLCLVLVFNAWLVYRQWSFRRLRKLASGFANDAQALPPQVLELAGLDPVTGLCTRSSLEQHLGKEVARARRQNTALSLATVHVDEFAHLTMRYGKPAVDAALKELGRRLKKASRGSDIAARLSDDDFLLLLPGRQRVVIEIDGKQHYADGETASPQRYATMVAEDRNLRLLGYEVYRFGGYELSVGEPRAIVEPFLNRLIKRGL